eukprot:1208890-Pyramimonas_sp.AAC.1
MNEFNPDTTVAGSAHLAERAAHDDCPALWRRGLMPLDRTTGHLPDPLDRTWFWGSFEDREVKEGG